MDEILDVVVTEEELQELLKDLPPREDIRAEDKCLGNRDKLSSVVLITRENVEQNRNTNKTRE